MYTRAGRPARVPRGGDCTPGVGQQSLLAHGHAASLPNGRKGGVRHYATACPAAYPYSLVYLLTYTYGSTSL